MKRPGKHVTRFCQWRLDHGSPSQQDIAKRAGLSGSTISMYVWGLKVPTMEHAVAIVEALRAMGYADVMLSDLFDDLNAGQSGGGVNASRDAVCTTDERTSSDE